MKKLAILAIFSSSVFAHEVPYSNPQFLDISGGDPRAAQQLESICSASGLSAEGCADKFAGSGNFGREAAQQCYERFARITFRFKINGIDTDIPGSRMHKVEGTVWHKDYVKSPETGRMHRHERSESDEKRAIAAYKSELIAQAILEKTGFGGSMSKTSGGGIEGGIDFGITVPVTLTINLSGKGEDSTTKNMAILSETEKQKIEAESEKARGDFSKGGIEPSIVCYQDEEKCSDGSPNKSYKKPEEKKEEKKSAENPPKHEDNTVHDIPDNAPTSDGQMMAGESTIDVSGVATYSCTEELTDPSQDLRNKSWEGSDE